MDTLVEEPKQQESLTKSTSTTSLNGRHLSHFFASALAYFTPAEDAKEMSEYAKGGQNDMQVPDFLARDYPILYVHATCA